MKKGFGIIEVLLAAVVLGFLVVGLTQLQLGNRETILRVRARDAANFVAQHVLDSISAGGMKSIENACPDNDDFIYCEDNYEYNFEGNPGIKVKTKYNVRVSLMSNVAGSQVLKTVMDTSLYTRAAGTKTSHAGARDTISQSLEAEVSWDFKKSKQSIKMARVVR